MRVNLSDPPADDCLHALFIKKLHRMTFPGYFKLSFVRYDIRCFQVRKGISDIRLVHNGTSSGVNLIVSIPSFFLATSRSLERLIIVNICQCDMDSGKFFLNFPMHLIVCAYCRINLTKFDEIEGESGNKRYRQCRTWMGFKPSPYLAI